MLLVAAPAQSSSATKKLTRYVAGEACKPVKPLTEKTQTTAGEPVRELDEDTRPTTESVEDALPAPPAGEKWRIGFAANAQGFIVRVFLGDQQVGSGLIRWDRSYRFLIDLQDFDIAGSPVDITGRLEGCDIFAKDPITKVTADIVGPIQFTETISLTKGSLVWDSEGIRLSGDAKIACATSGGLQGSATVDYRTPETWTLHILGSTDGPTCVMEEGFSIADATVGGTITAKAGVVDGKVTGRAVVAAPILPFGAWDATFELLMTGTVKKIVTTFSANASNPAGFATVTIGPDGELVIKLNLNTAPGGGPDTGPGADTYVDPGAYLDPASTRPSSLRCRIPSVKRGSTLTTTRRAMTKANCKTRVKRVKSNLVKKGRVVGLTQKRGKTFRAGTTITVRVSAGPGPRCKVPSIKRGATLASARRAMTKANCKVRVKRVKSNKVRKGRVVGVSQKRGKTFAAGTRITVRVSAG